MAADASSFRSERGNHCKAGSAIDGLADHFEHAHGNRSDVDLVALGELLQFRAQTARAASHEG